MKEYSSNTEPKVGDTVVLSPGDPNSEVFLVTSVLGGRLGNKVTIRPVDKDTGHREYYYYCLCPI